MDGSYKSRWLIWTGPLFAVVFLLADLLLGGNPPGEKATGADVISYFNAHRGRTLAEVFAVPALVALLVLFAGELRSRARARGAFGAGPATMFGGAVLWASGLLFAAVVDLGLDTASHHHQAQVAQTLSVLNNDDWMPFIAGIAVFMLGAGLTVLRSRLLPSWLGWVAVVVGVLALAGPGGFVGYFAAPLWIVVAGIVLARRDATADGGRSAARAGSTRQVPVSAG